MSSLQAERERIRLEWAWCMSWILRWEANAEIRAQMYDVDPGRWS